MFVLVLSLLAAWNIHKVAARLSKQQKCEMISSDDDLALALASTSSHTHTPIHRIAQVNMANIYSYDYVYLPHTCGNVAIFEKAAATAPFTTVDRKAQTAPSFVSLLLFASCSCNHSIAQTSSIVISDNELLIYLFQSVTYIRTF